MGNLLQVGVPFQGWIQALTFTDPEGVERVDCYGGPSPTVAEYAKEQGKEFKVLSDEEFNGVIREFMESKKTRPEPVTAERWEDMLNVLPPCRWSTRAGFSVFHVSEREYGNLVSWYAKRGESCWTFTQPANLSEAELSNILGGI